MDLSRCLRQSASAEALRHLTICNCLVDAAFNDGQGRFRHLRSLELKLRSDAVHISSVVWTHFEQWNKLIELHRMLQ